MQVTPPQKMLLCSARGGDDDYDDPDAVPSALPVGGGDRINPENARKSGRHGAPQLAQCTGQLILLDVPGAVLAPVARQYNTNFSSALLDAHSSDFILTVPCGVQF